MNRLPDEALNRGLWLKLWMSMTEMERRGGEPGRGVACIIRAMVRETHRA